MDGWMCSTLTSASVSDVISCSSSPQVLCLQVLLQELSGFVFAAKVKMTENGSMSTLRSVIKLCTQSSSRNRKVTVSLFSNTTES